MLVVLLFSGKALIADFLAKEPILQEVQEHLRPSVVKAKLVNERRKRQHIIQERFDKLKM